MFVIKTFFLFFLDFLRVWSTC